MVLRSQFIPVPGVCVVVTRTNAGFLCRTGQVQRAVSARNGEGTRAGKWEFTCADRAAAAGQESPAKISVPLHRSSSH